jgi:pimeloyl-ACP methyl ester carboxylesterase
LTHYITYKSSRISYQLYGNGPRLAICFHGYGENAETFAFLSKFGGNEFTFYSIDLPFHGQTDWKEGFVMQPHDLINIINQITGDQTSELILMGFSLGGRAALTVYQQIPSRVKKLVLMAPDGMKVNAWYWLATQNQPGNKLFAFTMKHPAWFFSMLKLLNRIGTVNSSIYKFVKHYIGDPEIRELLYKRWTTLRLIKPDIKQIKEFILRYKTRVHLIYGKHDRIILSARARKFRKGIEAQCKLEIINSGHQVLHEKHATEILKALMD